MVLTEKMNQSEITEQNTMLLAEFVQVVTQKAKELEITEHNTLLLTRKLLQIAIFNISYIRGLFPENYFSDKSVPALGKLYQIEMKVEQLMLMDIESGVYDDLQKKHLKTLLFCVCDAMVGPLIELMTTLDKMPKERTILMKLLYCDDVKALIELQEGPKGQDGIVEAKSNRRLGDHVIHSVLTQKKLIEAYQNGSTRIDQTLSKRKEDGGTSASRAEPVTSRESSVPGNKNGNTNKDPTIDEFGNAICSRSNQYKHSSKASIEDIFRVFQILSNEAQRLRVPRVKLPLAFSNSPPFSIDKMVMVICLQ